MTWKMFLKYFENQIQEIEKIEKLTLFRFAANARVTENINFSLQSSGGPI